MSIVRINSFQAAPGKETALFNFLSSVRNYTCDRRPGRHGDALLSVSRGDDIFLDGILGFV